MDRSNIETLSIYGDNWINTKHRVSGNVNIAFGNVDLKELIVKKPHCNIDIVMTYACTYCLEQPIAVLSSHNVFYESNCTFNKPLLSCNLEMYEITQISKNKYCRIFVPLLNQTIDLSFEYEYKGELTNMKSIKAETMTDIMSSIVHDSSFYISLISSLSSFLLITTISTIIIRLGRLGILAFNKKRI